MAEHDFDKYDLGDNVGDDGRLRAFLERMEERLSDDRPGTSRERTNWVFKALGSLWGMSSKFVQRVYRFLQDHLLGRSLYKAETKRVEAEAARIRAEGRATEKVAGGKAAVMVAEASTIVARQSVETLKALVEAGIDFEARTNDEGVLVIVVTKHRPPDTEPSPSSAP